MRKGEALGCDPHFFRVVESIREATLVDHDWLGGSEARQTQASEALLVVLEIAGLAMRTEHHAPNVVNSVDTPPVCANRPATLEMHLVNARVNDKSILSLAHLVVQAQKSPAGAI